MTSHQEKGCEYKINISHLAPYNPLFLKIPTLKVISWIFQCYQTVLASTCASRGNPQTALQEGIPGASFSSIMADDHEESGFYVDKDKNCDKSDAPSPKTAKGTTEPGIIYLSKIPQYMSVKKIKQIFEHHGELGRVFLQPDGKRLA